RRARTEAVPLSRALARGTRRSEVRAPDRLCADPAAHPPPDRSRRAEERLDAGQSAGGRRAAPREDVDSRRQRRVRTGQRVRRVDDDRSEERRVGKEWGRRWGKGQSGYDQEET